LLAGAPAIVQGVENESHDEEAMGPFSAWSTPMNLGPSINTRYSELHMAISADELSLFFASDRPGGFGRNDLWVAERSSRDDEWDPAQNLGSKFNTDKDEVCPSVSPDSHWLLFCSRGLGGFGGLDMFAAFRQDTSDNFDWEDPINLGAGVNSAFEDGDPALFVDPETGVTTMYFASTRPGLGDYDIYMSTLGDDGAFGPAILVRELSSPQRDAHPTIRRDGLEIFWPRIVPARSVASTSGFPPGPRHTMHGPRRRTSAPRSTPLLTRELHTFRRMAKDSTSLRTAPGDSAGMTST
jgi:hypothetical protein